MRKLAIPYAVMAILAVAAPAFAHDIPAGLQQNQSWDANSATMNRDTRINTASEPRNAYVPSYLLRKDGRLINGLLPTYPDAQG